MKKLLLGGLMALMCSGVFANEQPLTLEEFYIVNLIDNIVVDAKTCVPEISKINAINFGIKEGAKEFIQQRFEYGLDPVLITYVDHLAAQGTNRYLVACDESGLPYILEDEVKLDIFVTKRLEIAFYIANN